MVLALVHVYRNTLAIRTVDAARNVLPTVTVHVTRLASTTSAKIPVRESAASTPSVTWSIIRLVVHAFLAILGIHCPLVTNRPLRVSLPVLTSLYTLTLTVVNTPL